MSRYKRTIIISLQEVIKRPPKYNRACGTSLLVRPEYFYYLVFGKFQVKYMVGGGNKNKNKSEEKAESIKNKIIFNL